MANSRKRIPSIKVSQPALTASHHQTNTNITVIDGNAFIYDYTPTPVLANNLKKNKSATCSLFLAELL